jgi:hypothetical protein
MLPNDPPPITPEGRRAAERFRTIFFLIVAANIAIIAIIIWQRQIAGDALTSEEMDRVFAKALVAYNARDRDGFLAFFSTNAQPRADAAFFDSVILGEYHRDFGTVTSSTLDPARSSGKTRGYDVACEKHPHEKLTAEFIREDDTAKLLRWRMER